MAGISFKRIGWLVRRLSRISPAEIPYRIASVLRASAQARGWWDARCPPLRAADACFGYPWVHVPADHLVDSQFLVAVAEKTLTAGPVVFGVNVPLDDGAPAWNRDPKTGTIVDQTFGLSIDFRHLADGVDIKYLWELNRHVWWVPLAQTFAATGEQRFLQALSTLLDNWLVECPYARGANWSSPVEHGIRLINWSIVWHLIGGADSPMFASAAGQELRERWITSVYQHMRFASDNYSLHSSADNHLIGEAAGVFVAAHTWDLWAETRVLRVRAKTILEAEMGKQFAADGVNLEQAVCYHKFSLEFVLASMVTGEANGDGFSLAFMTRFQSAVEFLAAMMDCNGRAPAIGDSDDGKVFAFAVGGDFSAYDSMLVAGAAMSGSPAISEKLRLLGKDQTVDSLWLKIIRANPSEKSADAETALPTKFVDGGYLLMGRALHCRTEFRLTMDVGPLGSNKIAGHGHADALSVLLSVAGQDFLVDPGTFCYNAAPDLRHYFRGTSAHNTVVIDGMDQSIYGGSFLWLRDVNSTLHSYVDDGSNVVVEASHDGYMRLADPVKHTRAVVLHRDALEVWIEDRFDCLKPHLCEVRWHFAPECQIEGEGSTWTATREVGRLSLTLDSEGFDSRVIAGADNPPAGWYSSCFYERQASPVLISSGPISSGSVVRTRITFAPKFKDSFHG